MTFFAFLIPVLLLVAYLIELRLTPSLPEQVSRHPESVALRALEKR